MLTPSIAAVCHHRTLSPHQWTMFPALYFLSQGPFFARATSESLSGKVTVDERDSSGAGESRKDTCLSGGRVSRHREQHAGGCEQREGLARLRRAQRREQWEGWGVGREREGDRGAQRGETPHTCPECRSLHHPALWGGGHELRSTGQLAPGHIAGEQSHPAGRSLILTRAPLLTV